jgi:fimbrial chaperone protein
MNQHKSRIHRHLITLCGVAFTLSSHVAEAGSLRASPTSLSVAAPGGTATITVSSRGDGTTAGQVRVLRWLQTNGKDQLVPTRDVVASPPALRLDPGRDLTVRLVRTAKNPVLGEECYRVLVDQLPGAEQDKIAVKFAIRHSIPLCFDASTQKRSVVDWSLRKQGNTLVLTGHNIGTQRSLARDVVVTGPNGAKVNLGSAVVLGGSTMSWLLAGNLKGFASGADFTLKAKINSKEISYTGKISGG